MMSRVLVWISRILAPESSTLRRDVSCVPVLGPHVPSVTCAAGEQPLNDTVTGEGRGAQPTARGPFLRGRKPHSILTPPCVAVCDQLLQAPAAGIRLPQASFLHPLCRSVGRSGTAGGRVGRALPLSAGPRQRVRQLSGRRAGRPCGGRLRIGAALGLSSLGPFLFPLWGKSN